MRIGCGINGLLIALGGGGIWGERRPAAAGTRPRTFTWSQTKGADLMWVPMPFEKSLRLAYSRTCYGTGYYIYHQFVPGTKLSREIRAWDGKTPPDGDVLELIGRSGSDISPG